MRHDRTTAHSGRAKLALIVLGVFTCVGGAAYAFAQSGRPSASPATDHATAAGKPKALSIRAAPLTRLAVRGDLVEFRVRIRRRGRSKVRLSVLDGVPSGSTASFSPRSTRKAVSTLTIHTTGARAGGHRVRLLARSGRRRATAAINLIVSSPAPTNFTISGDLQTPLIPGSSAPLDLALTNPGPADVAITDLSVSVTGVSAPQESASFPCSTDDFEVSQFSGGYGFTLASSSTARLSELGFTGEQWPEVAMVNHPMNQNGCKGASLTLSFAGTATGGDE